MRIIKFVTIKITITLYWVVTRCSVCSINQWLVWICIFSTSFSCSKHFLLAQNQVLQSRWHHWSVGSNAAP